MSGLGVAEVPHRVTQPTRVTWSVHTAKPVGDGRDHLVDQYIALGQPAIEAWSLGGPQLDVAELATAVDHLVRDLGVVDNTARIVAGTKTLHHLLSQSCP